jgi:hypothetical protein
MVPIFTQDTNLKGLPLDWFIPSTKYCQELWSYSVTVNMAKLSSQFIWATTASYTCRAWVWPDYSLVAVDTTPVY